VFLVSVSDIRVCLVGSRIPVFEAVCGSLPPGADNAGNNHQCQGAQKDEANKEKRVKSPLWAVGIFSWRWQLALCICLVGLDVVASGASSARGLRIVVEIALI
jgi:hypothetical protein